MTYLLTNCATSSGNTGLQQCNGSPGRVERLWLVPPGTEIATRTDALLEATWDTLFNLAKGLRGLPLPTIFNATFEQGEDTYETGWSNKQDFAHEGLDKDIYTLDKISLYNASQLRTLNGVSWAAYKVTDSGIIEGWSDDGIKFKPFSIQDFRVGKRTPENGEAVERVPITIVWADPDEWNNYPAVIEPTWNPLELDGIKDIYATASSPSTTGVTLTLTGYDGVPHEGAVLADFIIYNSLGASITVSSATEGDAGVYALLATLPGVTYTAGLKTQPNATTKYFETPTLASFTR
jgi:hypothetical protein